MKLLHTENIPGNLHEVAHVINKNGWAEKVVYMELTSSKTLTVVVLLLDSEELLKIRSSPRYDFSHHTGGVAFDFPTKESPVTDIDRLVHFCAVQDVHIRDNCDNADPIYGAWRYLPDHLQKAINTAAHSIDKEREQC